MTPQEEAPNGPASVGVAIPNYRFTEGTEPMSDRTDHTADRVIASRRRRPSIRVDQALADEVSVMIADRDLSVQDVADRAGIPKRRLVRLLSGDRTWKLQDAFAVGRAIDPDGGDYHLLETARVAKETENLIEASA